MSGRGLGRRSVGFALFSWRPWQGRGQGTDGRRTSRGYEEACLESALALDGCPICHYVADHDRKFFFWFFNENYLELHTLDALTRSLGFCSRHAAEIARSAEGTDQLAAVHRVLIVRLRRRLSQWLSRSAQTTLAPSAPCPACQSRQESMDRGAYWMARYLEEDIACDRYGQPGLLRYPHLQNVARHVSRPVLERLLTVHEDALAAALKSIDAPNALVAALRLSVGQERRLALPRFDPAPVHETLRDPVKSLLEALCSSPVCPVCRECQRTWMDWGRWLNASLERRRAVEDLLPACPDHVWALVQRTGVDLAKLAVDHMLNRIDEVIRVANKVLHTPDRPSTGFEPVTRLRALFAGRRREAQARQNLLRIIPCAICRRLEIMEERSFALLVAVLENPQHRAAVAQGGGLCFKHLAGAVAHAPSHVGRSRGAGRVRAQGAGPRQSGRQSRRRSGQGFAHAASRCPQWQRRKIVSDDLTIRTLRAREILDARGLPNESLGIEQSLGRGGGYRGWSGLRGA